jgi:hypothetical protein
MPKAPPITKLRCKVCNWSTNHTLVWTGHTKFFEEEIGVEFFTDYYVLQCNGCEEFTFATVDYNDSDGDVTEEGQFIPTKIEKLYPDRKAGMLREKQCSFYSPPIVRRIYTETIQTYNSEQLTLCAMGIRATMEAICNDAGIPKDNLKNRIEKLVEKGVVTQKLAEGLQENRLLGNESAHDLELYGSDELATAIDLVEQVMEHYFLPHKIEMLKQRKARNSN